MNAKHEAAKMNLDQIERHLSHRKTRVELRIDTDLHAALVAFAKERKRSLNNLIEVILAMAVEDDAPDPLIAEIERRTA